MPSPRLSFVAVPTLALVLLQVFPSAISAKGPIKGPPPSPTSAAAHIPPLKAGDPFTEPGTGVRLRWVPPGTYTVGSPDFERGRRPHEFRRDVILTRGLWMAETEVTQELWREVVGNAPSSFRSCGPDCPVDWVSWYEAILFTNALSRRAGRTPCYRVVKCKGKLGAGCPNRGVLRCEDGLRCKTVERVDSCDGFRLPTEAEWEVAARAGTQNAQPEGGLLLRDVNDAPQLEAWAWYAGNSGVDDPKAWPCSDWKGRAQPARWCSPRPVATKQANAWGLYDMLGNLLEFCEDRAEWNPKLGRIVTSTDADATASEPVADPIGTTGRGRALRGGSWYAFPRDTRFAHRGQMPPSTRNRTVGFRVVLTNATGIAPATATLP